jgi:outer membrane protein OmpA-like peptidoglycan-associated protein
MRAPLAPALAAAVVVSACGLLGTKEDTRAGGGASVQGSGRVAPLPGAPAGNAAAAAASEGWIDPEPADAQPRAEAVLSLPQNADKTTQLTMSMTTLVDSKTGIEGFRSAVAPSSTTLDQRLSRLGAEVSGTEITIRLPGSVLFDFDSAQIRPDAERTLSEVASVINGYAKRPVRIEGHTDSIASDDYNQKLSERRAQSVRGWLAAKGVEGGRLAPRGFGESKPVADNGTADGRQRNRRVEVIIEKGS